MKSWLSFRRVLLAGLNRPGFGPLVVRLPVLVIFGACALGFASLFSACSSTPPTSQFNLPGAVKTAAGDVSGIEGRNSDITVFKGIPFAAPPVGDLRWKAPQPVTPWAGVKVCDQYSPSAIQSPQAPFMMWSKEFIIDTSKGSDSYSEDCLYLNVWTNRKSTSDKRPVLVFIHGGGLTNGGASCEIYDGEALAAKGLVVVTINYRVNILGFLATSELAAESPDKVAGNYGLLDQIAALKWVRQNIAAFGGDPHNVTIQGQSAGSMSVHAPDHVPPGQGPVP